MELKGLKINFLGDSITMGVGASCNENIFHRVLRDKVGLADARNYGISGTRFALQHNRTQATHDNNAFTERFDKMLDDADAVVVFGGTNDYGHGDAPLGEPSDRTPETFYGACHYLFSGLIKKYIGKPIVIMTPLHRTDECKGTDTPDQSLKTYVDIIREVAEIYSLPVLDLFKESGMQPLVPEVQKMYFIDHVHPNDNGHALIAHKLQMFLERL